MTGDSDKGHFVLPTLVSGLDNRASLVQEEQFGPTLPLIAYDSLDQAIEMVNDSDFGLGASVWSADAERAEQVAREMEAGMTCWPGANPSAPGG